MADMKPKNCPFCDCNIITELEHEYEGEIFYSRDCTKCGASSNWFDNRKMAKQAWNARATDSTIEAQEAEIKRLRSALEFYADNTNYDARYRNYKGQRNQNITTYDHELSGIILDRGQKAKEALYFNIINPKAALKKGE